MHNKNLSNMSVSSESLKHVLSEFAQRYIRCSFLHDRGRPHISRHSIQEIVKTGWEVLRRLPYSSSIWLGH